VEEAGSPIHRDWFLQVQPCLDFARGVGWDPPAHQSLPNRVCLPLLPLIFQLACSPILQTSKA